MLSIITINHNHEAGLNDTIASLAQQTDQHFQWVFIDGLSTDGSIERAKSFARPGDIVVSEKDFGIYNAMNKGAELANGEAVLFLNSGDVFADDRAVTDIYNHWHSRVDLLLYGFEVRGVVRMPKPLWWRVWNLPTSHQAIVYRRAYLSPQMRFNETYRYLADYEHFLRLPIAKMPIERIRRLLVVNENYGTDAHIPVVCQELKIALLTNSYPLWVCKLLAKVKLLYLQRALK
jgi:glycosyltransferase involved in cell wall biosynthesis